MLKEYKDPWVAALRSGKYKQTTGRLVDMHGHCCLGVLCDVVPAVAEQFDSLDRRAWTQVLNLTPSAAKLAGLSDDNLTTLANMNDGCGSYVGEKSFAEIADYIEANL